MNEGKLYLIPVPIADGALQTLSPDINEYTRLIQHYFVENIRTARRFLRLLHSSIVIDDLQFSEIDKHNGPDIALLKKWLKDGHNIGIMSESGCPGIADPGAELVKAAQQMNVTVIPLTGPSSIILSLMASGLNGQSFCFNGYLPVKEPTRSQKMKALEQISRKENQTQIFIETPYRNNVLLDELIKNCQNSTRLCIAMNITGQDAFIKTKTIAEWKAGKPVLEKLPAVFLFLA